MGVFLLKHILCTLAVAILQHQSVNAYQISYRQPTEIEIKIFNYIDKDKDGRLTYFEFTDYFRQYGASAARQIWLRCANQDNVITIYQWIRCNERA